MAPPRGVPANREYKPKPIKLVDGDKSRIDLGHGNVALIDEGDFDTIKHWCWHATRSDHRIYAVHDESIRGRARFKRIYMHRLITAALSGQIVDHISGDTLDNRRCNLRFVTPHQNAMNRGPTRNSTSPYRGVNLFKRDGTWHAAIKRRYLGTYKSAAEAAVAYDAAAVKEFGEYARLNFPSDAPIEST